MSLVLADLLYLVDAGLVTVGEIGPVVVYTCSFST
jgi:hypothetical protein